MSNLSDPELTQDAEPCILEKLAQAWDNLGFQTAHHELPVNISIFADTIFRTYR
jgi:hypothetical protein